MIKVGFDVAVAFVLSLVIVFILVLWGRERRRSQIVPGIEEDEGRNMRPCPYCRHVCVNVQHKKIIVCPVCKSYFDEETT
jgi:hypothetical protein